MLELINVAAFTNPKSILKNNEDTVLLPTKKNNGYVFAIADGVGSYPGARQASQAVIEFLNNYNNYPIQDVEGRLRELNDLIGQLELSDLSFKNAATTLTVGFIDETGIHVIHVGDSRLYLKKENKLVQLTKDHTQHQKMLDAGLFTERQLRKMPGKNILMSALAKNVDLDYQYHFVEMNDLINEENEIVLNIMSDGAYDFWEKRPKFSPNTMSSPSAFAMSLQRRIIKNEPTDDYSLISMKYRKLD